MTENILGTVGGLTVQRLAQMYRVTEYRLVTPKTFLTIHISCSHIVQLPPNYLLHRSLHTKQWSKCQSIYVVLYDLFVGLTSKQNGQQLWFWAWASRKLRQYYYFYNDFTIKASLLNLYTISDRCLYLFFSNYVLYLDAFAQRSLRGKADVSLVWLKDQSKISDVTLYLRGLKNLPLCRGTSSGSTTSAPTCNPAIVEVYSGALAYQLGLAPSPNPDNRTPDVFVRTGSG